jgi:NAD-dependent DNA ligase
VPAEAPSSDRPLAGQQVAILGKLNVLSRRDARALIERLGGTFSTGLTPRTTAVVAGDDGVDVPAQVAHVLSESLPPSS